MENMDNAGGANEPPPLPPRPDQPGYNAVSRPYQMGMSGYSPYGNMSSPYSMMGGYGSMGGYGGAGYGSYGGYGGYGGGGYGMSRYGMPGHCEGSSGDQNDFMRLAEESSRQAFQSIESIVHAFGSVAMMLESTYFAVHSSFRAVLGVAEHLTRMKGQVSGLVQRLAIIKTLHWFARRLAYLIGLSRNDPKDEAMWKEAAAKATELPLSPEGVLDALTRDDAGRRKSSWPIMIFFAVVCGTPWLIWKLLSKITGTSSPNKEWMTGTTDHYIATALYNFETQSPKEVSFKTGQQILIAPKDCQPHVRGWLLATVDGVKSGLVPVPYLKVEGFIPATAPKQSSQPLGN
ncbi:Peroxisomal membrane protein PEX13 [Halotydeus destructor]|nr:Peroxisomal membrane protein PEX13 [Halotydeus destructor]